MTLWWVFLFCHLVKLETLGRIAANVDLNEQTNKQMRRTVIAVQVSHVNDISESVQRVW